MYELVIKEKALRFLERLPEHYRRRISDRIEDLRASPYPRDAAKIRGLEQPVFRVRVGDYRVVYYVRAEEATVYIMLIDKRGRVYERL